MSAPVESVSARAACLVAGLFLIFAVVFSAVSSSAAGGSFTGCPVPDAAPHGCESVSGR